MKIHQANPETPATLKELAARNKRNGLVPLEENGVVFEPIVAKTILTRNPNPDLRHHWSINPYRGCQFGCTYCFARYTANFIEINDPLEFERRIFYKANAPELVRRLRDSDFYGKPVLLGAGTDPWQPAEGRYKVTRGILEGLLRYPSLDLFCLTKSSLIRRDADLLGRLVKEGRPVGVGFSITTLDVELAKKMEPFAALPQERLKAMRILADVGVNVGLMAMPVVPGLTDSEESLDALLRAAREHGARFARANVLHLRSAPKLRFMPWLEKEFPHLARQYHSVYDYSAYHQETYREDIRDRFEGLKAKYGFQEFEMVHRQPRRGEQLNLF
jgi:DNA repair photolyase